MHAAHQVKIFVAEEQRHEFIFFHAHAVFAGERTTQLDTIAEDFMGSGDGVSKLQRIAWIVKDDGMEVAVTGVENVADGEVVFLADLGNLLQGLGELGAGNDAVEDVVAGSEASQRAKGVLAAFPEEVALA